MLNKAEIKQLIEQKQLIQGYLDLALQLTPNGFDLTAGQLYKFNNAGALDFSNQERRLAQAFELTPQKKQAQDDFGWWHLKPGAYKVKTNETVNLANNLVALAFSRTSLLRMGGFTQNGVWDAGFCGKGEFLLVVTNSLGLSLKQNARLVQLVFFRVEETEEYQGIYKNLQ